MHFPRVIAITLVRMRQYRDNSASGLKLQSPSISAAMIYYNGDKMLAIFLLTKVTISILQLRMQGDGYLEEFLVRI